MLNKIKSALFGLAVGDALGVPVEFKTRSYLKLYPLKEMIGNGSWNQPVGTWSDDSSLAFCLAESLTEKYDLDNIAKNFTRWRQEGYWGAHHRIFDIGNATRDAIHRLINGTSPLLSGGMMEDDNGNGSLMRILPLLFYTKDLRVNDRFQMVKEVSSVTHAHFRSVLACFIYMEVALEILREQSPQKAYENMKQTLQSFFSSNDFNVKELQLFDRILRHDIKNLEETDILSGGYVLHTLEASLWCLLNTNNYTDAVLKAVNLGADTDTTACVTGGLAGLVYGYDSIPDKWINNIARKNDIDDLCNRLNKKISNGQTT